MSLRWCKFVAGVLVILSVGIASFGPPRVGWAAPIPAATGHPRPTAVTKEPSVSWPLARYPVAFEANVGQFDSRAKFISRNPSYNLFLTSSGAVLSIQKRGEKDPEPGPGSTPGAHPRPGFPENTYYAVVGVKLLGSNPEPKISGFGKLPTTSNYFIGSDASQWRQGIPNYARVRYRGVYPGVDVIFGGANGNFEYDFTVAPGASPGAIRLGFQGFDSVRLDSRGNLVLGLGSDHFVQRRPFLFQQNSEGQQVVQGRYTIRGRGEVGFEVGAFDRSRPLYIDPVLSYATYLGGSDYDSGTATAVDAAGNTYITGWTSSTNFPVTTGAFDTSCGGSSSCGSSNSDIFVTKLSSDGSTVVYSTFIGGSSVDVARGIAVDGLGNVYVVGHTTSTNYPTTSGTVQRTFGGAMDAVVTKLNANGTALGFSTYLGGTGLDEGTAIALDTLGNVYVTGLTYSTNFPTTVPLQAANGGDADAFATEINAAGSALIYSTYLGGSGYDRANGIAVDAQTNAYVTGITRSANFPVIHPVQSTCASCPTFGDAFVTEIQSGGVGLGYSTYLGGNQEDEGFAVAADAQGSAYMAGFSCSTNYPVTAGAFQTAVNGFCDAVVTKLRPGGSGLAYSTYFGGGALDFGQAITQMAGNAYITGQTYSTDLPLASSVQSTCGSSSCNAGTAFIAELKADGSAPVFSTYLGGSSTDQGHGIGVDSVGNAYIAGDTISTNLPTSSKSVQLSFGGGRGDAWAAKITLAPAASLSPTSLTFGSQPVNTTSGPQTVSLSNPGTAPLLISSITATGDFGQSNNCGNALAAGSTCSINVTFTPTAGGTRTGTLTVSDNAATSPQAASLTGTGSTSGVTLSPTSLTFSSQVVGTSSPSQIVTLSNSLSTTVTISSIAITGTNAGDFAKTTTCGASVAAGANCTISVTFTPTATGTSNAALTVTESSPSASQTVILTGTGISPLVTLSPTSLILGNQTVGTSSLPQTVMLSNAGSSSLSITGISIGGTNPADFAQTNNCGTSLAAGASCSINVTFTPSAIGTRSAILSVADSAASSPQTA
ncbi:MAG TPA: choice-of-anchor D domain-containing protein, partial [Terriglobia bacterium]|nr:choice-of-anchor D domain-containing protein [Terriglobia bacterium]